MDNRYKAARLISTLSLFYAGVILLGLLTGLLIELLLVASIALLVWHYLNLNRLRHYLWQSRRFAPPEGSGSWRPVFDGIYKLQMRNQQRRSQLGELVRRFREGAEALPDAVMLIGQHHVILWSNTQAHELLGLRWPEDRGQRIDNLVRSPEFGHFIRARNDKEPLILTSPIDTQRQLEMRLMPYGDHQRLLVIRDITLLVRLENMRRDFVANVSHELRTPLTVVKGYLEMLSDPSQMDPAMWQQVHRMLVSQTDRMDSLVSQLTELSSLESARQSKGSQRIDVSQLLAIVEQEVDAVYRDKQLQVTFDVTPGIDMFGEPRQMRSAFSNLIFNAVKYTPAGRHIEVVWKKVAAGALFSVKDDGDGIEPEHLLRLTERFYRVDKARSRDTGGSGLGLSIVKHALGNHQSELKIRSTVGKGSCFSFEIPAHLLDSRRISEQANES
ncbi:two-component system sensor histidine kinase PhoR [Corallincola holothuriorum]|uniref:Phosphate regulon sensor protein PhoR n=1 Tax=Corallincola holothuriorum TaxID=2282215 RepID=A0A368NI53_9GAMM|nr:phosphate regulon sensor histidine kinase PhoR [Corallincola holothuriorum]RCU49099.1 two-component system sensor histidine kinase PhoR [Corallincola holothuriorum]